MAATDPDPAATVDETTTATTTETPEAEAPELEVPEVDEVAEASPRRGFRLPSLPRIRIPLPRIRIRLVHVINAAIVIVILAILGGLGAAAWFFGVPFAYRLLHHGQPMPVAPKVVRTPRPTPKPSPTLMPLPPEAPAVTDGLDPTVVGPFALRLAGINKLVGTKIVTTAEYHDSDAGQRYFTAIVTSCKDLLARWPLQNGSLERLQERFRLEQDFDKFVFVERDSDGQWGLASCDNSM